MIRAPNGSSGAGGYSSGLGELSYSTEMASTTKTDSVMSTGAEHESTAQLVSQLTAVICSLQAHASGLRNENMNLRHMMSENGEPSNLSPPQPPFLGVGTAPGALSSLHACSSRCTVAENVGSQGASKSSSSSRPESCPLDPGPILEFSTPQQHREAPRDASPPIGSQYNSSSGSASALPSADPKATAPTPVLPGVLPHAIDSPWTAFVQTATDMDGILSGSGIGGAAVVAISDGPLVQDQQLCQELRSVSAMVHPVAPAPRVVMGIVPAKTLGTGPQNGRSGIPQWDALTSAVRVPEPPLTGLPHSARGDLPPPPPWMEQAAQQSLRRGDEAAVTIAVAAVGRRDLQAAVQQEAPQLERVVVLPVIVKRTSANQLLSKTNGALLGGPGNIPPSSSSSPPSLDSARTGSGLTASTLPITDGESLPDGAGAGTGGTGNSPQSIPSSTSFAPDARCCDLESSFRSSPLRSFQTPPVPAPAPAPAPGRAATPLWAASAKDLPVGRIDRNALRRPVSPLSTRVSSPLQQRSRCSSFSERSLIQGPIQATEDTSRRDETSLAEQLLKQMLAGGLRPERSSFDSIITAFDRVGDFEKAQEWLWRMIEEEYVPSEQSFAVVIFGCNQAGQPERAKLAVMEMQRLHNVSGRSCSFEDVLSAYAALGDALRKEVVPESLSDPAGVGNAVSDRLAQSTRAIQAATRPRFSGCS